MRHGTLRGEMMTEQIKILQLEDDDSYAKLIGMMLEKTRPCCMIMRVQRLTEAREALRGGDFDIILLDLGLPDSQGLESLHGVKELAPEVPIVVLTGVEDEEFALRTIREGADDYLTKDRINEVLLLRTMRHAIERRRTAEIIRENEARLRFVTQRSPDTMFIQDRDLRYVWIGRPLYPFAPEGHLGKTDFDLAGPHDAEVLTELKRKVIREGTPVSTEIALAPEGLTRIFKANFEPWKNHGGRVIGIAGYVHDITERKHQEAGRAELAAIVEGSDDAIFAEDLEGFIRTWNHGAERIYGYGAAEIIGRRVSTLVPPGYPDDLSDIMAKIRREGPLEHYVTKQVTKGGGIISVSLTISPLRDSDGKLIGAATIARDITKQTREEEDLVRWGQIFKNIRIGVVVQSIHEARLELVNPAFARMHGYETHELMGKPISDVFAPQARKELALMISAADEKGYHSFETHNRRKDGSTFPALVDINAVRNDRGELLYRIFNIRDLTDQKKAEEAIQYQAFHDTLTGLPNRAQLIMKLELEAGRSDRKEKKIALVHMGLDRFRSVNESLGHAGGDRVILAVADRLKKLIGKGDTLARVGSDEFIVLLADIIRPEEGALFAENIIDALNKPFLIDDREIYLTVSIGISIYPEDSTHVEGLLKNADVALAYIKRRGRGNYQFFNPALNRRTVERIVLENELRQAIRRQELVLYYQPQIDTYSGKIRALEALVRWKHAKWGLLEPSSFIPAAEEIGFMPHIDEWALRTACRQSKAWQRAGHSPLRISVNLSAQQFLSPKLVPLVRSILRETGLEAKYLDIEITESTAMRDIDLAVINLRELQQLGVVLSIDDFGTGFSSLTYLKKFPVHQLKIDKSFIRGLARDRDDQAIVKAVISMAHNLKLQVIAEGVERKEQLNFLQAQHCDEIQGFIYGKPVSADKAEALLAP